MIFPLLNKNRDFLPHNEKKFSSRSDLKKEISFESNNLISRFLHINRDFFEPNKQQNNTQKLCHQHYHC